MLPEACTSPRALGGGPLLGDNIVRMAFLDEAGIGDPRHEPFVVVGGILLNADKQWKAVEKRLEELWYEHMPQDCPDGYPFHATELFSGGKVFTRERYDREARWAILEKILAIPAEFNLPVFGGFRERAVIPNAVECYENCFIAAATGVEAYMRMQPDRHEVAMLILEDNHQVREHVQDALFHMRNPRSLRDLNASDRDRLWLTRVMGEPHFESKSAISPLQVADAVCFAMKRHLMGKRDGDRFHEHIRSQIVGALKPTTDQDRR